MKIAVIGYSGSGKSTLARELGKRCGADVLHLDSVHFLPDWQEREVKDERNIVESFLNSRDCWVIDGNYTKLSYDRRMEEADHIIMMLFGRLDCLIRVIKRYHKYRNKTRADMAEGCNEKLDFEFIKWVLWKGRRKPARERYKRLREQYPEKTVILKDQKQSNDYMKTAFR